MTKFTDRRDSGSVDSQRHDRLRALARLLENEKVADEVLRGEHDNREEETSDDE